MSFLRTARRCIHHACRNHDHLPKKGDRVVVAMSGGVDSSVTARLLANEDYDLSAVFMRNWDTRDESGTDEGCEWKRDWEDVQRVCRLLGLPCEMVDLSREYWTRVFEPSLRLWEQGETPNPDVWCNREIKFGALMDRLVPRNARWLATGHYAGVEWENSPQARPKLVRPLDRIKDQTHYLSNITESSLRKTLFPLQGLAKSTVRELARKYELPTAARSESMGLCFVGQKRRFSDFLSNYIQPRPGRIINLETGKPIGTHSGLWTYTIGQNARVSGCPERMFVAMKDTLKHDVFVVPGPNHPALASQGIISSDFNWIWLDAIPSEVQTLTGLNAQVQYRHRMEDVPCVVKQRLDNSLEIRFTTPQRGVSAGQIAALYVGDWCLGSGLIAETMPSPQLQQLLRP